ncbi:MAG: hypothetical protein EON56_03905 [Alphaproteobacteria bacterium]|nr:MAG: hypothetical protein EON56_03905 [Alphaproteobacteria bacterium]
MTEELAGLFRVIAYDSTNLENPPKIAGVPDNFYPLLGRIVTQWAIMEQEAEVLTVALLETNRTSEAG